VLVANPIAHPCESEQTGDPPSTARVESPDAGEPTSPETPAEQPSGHPSEPSQPKKGPKYLDLRYDEDFSYLDGGPDSYRYDVFDSLKNIRLGEDWRLSLGGEFRFRMESETNLSFGATEPANDTFQHYRFFLHGDLKYRHVFRVFVQGVEAFDEDRDLALRPLDENRWDLHQLFFDVRLLGESSPWTVRVGRQELNYGNQRLVSPLDWATARRRFDGVKLFARTEAWDVEVFYVKPVLVQRKQRDRYDEDFDFYGVYATIKSIPRHKVDIYFFAVDNTADLRNPNSRSGDKSTYTLGTRFSGNTAAFDYEAELAGQWGHWAGDTVEAWMVAVDGGYTFDDPHKPRFGVGFDWATGDEDPTDSRVQTFDQLFPLGHKYLGYLDLVGRQNVIAANASISFWPIPETVRAAVAWHYFWLDHESDALYNAAGVPTRRDATGNSGREVGSELDVTASWQMDIHSSFLAGWSHLWDADFIHDTGVSEDADLFYIQYSLKF